MDTTSYHDGSWKIISLRSLGGDGTRTDPGGPSLQEYSHTPNLEHAPYFRSILDRFGSYLRTARLSVVNPGQRIAPHCDTFHDFCFGQIRLHIPIMSNSQATMTINGISRHWGEGELWFGDFGKQHEAVNAGGSPRIHLILDVNVHEELLSLFPEDYIQLVRRAGIRIQPERGVLVEGALSRFNSRFTVSAALVKGIFETDDGISPRFPAEIVNENHQLVFKLSGRALFGLLPISETELMIRGWGMERTFVFDFDELGLRTLFLCLWDGNRKTEIKLPLEGQ